MPTPKHARTMCQPRDNAIWARAATRSAGVAATANRSGTRCLLLGGRARPAPGRRHLSFPSGSHLTPIRGPVLVRPVAVVMLLVRPRKKLLHDDRGGNRDSAANET